MHSLPAREFNAHLKCCFPEHVNTIGLQLVVSVDQNTGSFLHFFSVANPKIVNISAGILYRGRQICRPRGWNSGDIIYHLFTP